jgi:hypothetical protein
MKAETMKERMIFPDDDKRSALHDEIQMWCYDNIDKVTAECWKTANYKAHEKVFLEKPICTVVNGKNVLVGFADLVVNFFVGESKSNCIDYTLIIEVKSRVSIGELLRQLAYYKHHMRGVYMRDRFCFLVVSPDDRYKSQIEEQGYRFYKYEKP